ncbi:hypothetical protein H3H36_01265 [Duganella sp. FT3S]|uniref:SIR2-like domain-containing protein n=1 Tax=Rugamonas fusca TaxID=2758568 RepID=A0A7W2I548_9BURK|nr:hypothetical protein [Rugamonas fusca]MBA5603992.1 hypothetical protein [Rugamonas fusca]
MGNLALIVGNGLSIDLRYEKKYFWKFNPSKPLSWDFYINQKSGKISWKEAFPKFFDYYQSNKEEADRDNFLLFRDIGKHDDYQLRIEARHFLALAFSYYDNHVFPSRFWKWPRFIQQYAPRISDIISFNYDTIVERALSMVVLGYVLHSAHNHLPSVFKPHGCSRMDGTSKGILIEDEHGNPHLGYPLKCWRESNDFDEFDYLEYSETMVPRRESYCVLPHERNIFKHFQTQKPIWNQMHSRLGAVQHCLIIGHSYGEVDRPEIDQILDLLPENTTIHICNPFPPVDLIEKVKSTAREYSVHKDVPTFELK